MTGGLPRLTTDLVRDRDGIVHFSNLQLYSPKLRLLGSGLRYRDGTFHIVASGRQAKYGPLKLVLDGHIERPKVELLLARPNDALGIRDMRLLLQPTAAGFDYRASRRLAARAVYQQRADPAAPQRADGHRDRQSRRRRLAWQRPASVRPWRVYRPPDLGQWFA